MPFAQTHRLRLHYEVCHSGDPLLLIAGYCMPGHSWRRSLDQFSRFQSVYFDNRGTGLSDKPDQTAYSIDEMAEDASALLRCLKVGPARIFGFSMGGMIALELALRHPDQVRKAVIASAHPGWSTGTPPAFPAFEELRQATRQRRVDLLADLLFSPEILAKPSRRLLIYLGLQMALGSVPAATVERAMEGILAFDPRDRLSAIKCPALVVHAENDRIVPIANAKILTSMIPGAKLIIAPGAGHVFHTFDSYEVNQRIAAWLSD